VGEHLLDVLALQRIAAYLQPAVDLNPITRTAIIPARPADRLFVDRAHLDTARGYLAQLAEDQSGTITPHTDVATDLTADVATEGAGGSADVVPDGTDAGKLRPDPTGTEGRPNSDADSAMDQAWAQIVAGYHAQVDATSASWPEAENIAPDPGTGRASGRDKRSPDPDPGPSPGREGDSGTEGGPDNDARADDDGGAAARGARRDLDRLGRVDNLIDLDLGNADRLGNIDRFGKFDRSGDLDSRNGSNLNPSAEGWRPPTRANPRDSESSLLDSLDNFGAEVELPDDDEGYTPPPPPPLPHISKYAVLAVLAIIAGFVLFLNPDLLPIDNNISMLFGFTGILAGFVTLIWRLRPDDDDDDYDPDDGARV
jgi:hypothetical protein